MYAIIEACGHQIRVAKDDIFDIDLFEDGAAEIGRTITFDKVLLVSGDAGAKIGKPYLAGASVSAEVVDGKVLGDKIHIWKFRAKKWFRRHTGHRQPYTRVKITAIAG